MKQRNYVIDFWKMVFCILVLLYHSIYYAEDKGYSLFIIKKEGKKEG